MAVQCERCSKKVASRLAIEDTDSGKFYCSLTCLIAEPDNQITEKEGRQKQ